MKEKWGILHEKHNINFPNKVHILCDHVADYVEISGLPLGATSDQLIEASHQYVHKQMKNGGYLVKDKSTKVAKDKTFKCIQHINSYNI